MLLLSLIGTFVLDPRIFADEGQTGLPCHTLVPQFCILKSMSCPVAACRFFLIPVKETTSRFTPVCFQEDAVLTLILRDKYLFGATLFIYPALFFFLDQWEQSTSSFPCWEMTAGLVSQVSNQKTFWVLVSMSGHVSFSLYDCILLTLTLWLIFNKPAVKQHSRVLICHLSPRKSHGTHLMTCGQWLGDGHPS